jgi:hypothetical protein
MTRVALRDLQDQEGFKVLKGTEEVEGCRVRLALVVLLEMKVKLDQ